jgi:hypothetical protein
MKLLKQPWARGCSGIEAAQRAAPLYTLLISSLTFSEAEAERHWRIRPSGAAAEAGRDGAPGRHLDYRQRQPRLKTVINLDLPAHRSDTDGDRLYNYRYTQACGAGELAVRLTFSLLCSISTTSSKSTTFAAWKDRVPVAAALSREPARNRRPRATGRGSP